MADLEEAKFEVADLAEGGVESADLEEAEFEEADLAEAELELADLEEAEFEEADLAEAELMPWNVHAIILIYPNLSIYAGCILCRGVRSPKKGLTWVLQ